MLYVCVCIVLVSSLGQLITMAGLDKSRMPFPAKPPGCSDEYINGQSRLDTTQQMRAILEQSRLDESILSADLQPAYNGRRARSSNDPTQQCSREPPSFGRNGRGSKFDELYRQALRNADSILSDSGNPPDGRVTLQNLHSPVRSVDYVPSDNDSQLDASAVQSDIHLVKPAGSAKSGQNGLLPASSDIAGKPPASLHLQESHHLDGQEPATSVTSARSQDVDRSVDSGRVDETEISEDYTTEEDDDIEEIKLTSQ